VSDWGWIAFGYTTVYGIVAVYGALLVRRVTVARRAGRTLEAE
jgi:hypothetical protein